MPYECEQTVANPLRIKRMGYDFSFFFSLHFLENALRMRAKSLPTLASTCKCFENDIQTLRLSCKCLANSLRFQCEYCTFVSGSVARVAKMV